MSLHTELKPCHGLIISTRREAEIDVPPRLRGLVDKLERAVRMHCYAKKDIKAGRKEDATKAKLELLRAIAVVACAPPKQPNPDSVLLLEAIEDACSLLPYGWLIEINAEREAAWVALHDSKGDKVDFPTNNERLDYTVNDAVEFALLSTCPPEVNSR